MARVADKPRSRSEQEAGTALLDYMCHCASSTRNRKESAGDAPRQLERSAQCHHTQLHTRMQMQLPASVRKEMVEVCSLFGFAAYQRGCQLQQQLRAGITFRLQRVVEAGRGLSVRLECRLPGFARTRSAIQANPSRHVHCGGDHAFLGRQRATKSSGGHRFLRGCWVPATE